MLKNILTIAVIFFSIAVRLTSTQDDEVSDCHVYGDPHLTTFAVAPGQDNTRLGFLCKIVGRYLMLKNKYVELYVNATDSPHWNEDYELKLLSGTETLCTLTTARRNCNHPLVSVDTFGSALSIVYPDADYLQITIFSYSVNGHNVYDIHVTQSYPLILQSIGLCTTTKKECILESVPNPAGKRKKRGVTLAQATEACNIFMAEANKTARALVGNAGSLLTAHAQAACVKDIYMTGDPSWGESTVGYVLLDALKTAKLSHTVGQTKLRAILPAVATTASQAKQQVTLVIPRADYF